MALGFAFINATHQFSILNTSESAPVTSTSTQSPRIQQAVVTPKATILAETASIAPPRRVAHLAAQISADDHMLRAIDASLDPSTDSPAALGLRPAAAPTPGPLASIQD
jgi:hypothetical protein